MRVEAGALRPGDKLDAGEVERVIVYSKERRVTVRLVGGDVRYFTLRKKVEVQDR